MPEFKTMKQVARNPVVGIVSRSATASLNKRQDLADSLANNAIPFDPVHMGKFNVEINGRVKIQIVNKDIILEKSDAIVNPSNIFLEHTGGIAGQIIIQGGFNIQKESHKWVKKNGSVSTGTCAFTSGGNLAASYVLHTPGPVHKNYTEKKSLDLLKSCIIKSLDTARKLGTNQSNGQFLVYPLN
mmetsp:Transcript_37483/g.57392  ORF Transcript_37483/g.57392 Transcript_37483/m.57392 type:complete len:185 (+) Transcript_37483:5477-6031(+)